MKNEDDVWLGDLEFNLQSRASMIPKTVIIHTDFYELEKWLETHLNLELMMRGDTYAHQTVNDYQHLNFHSFRKHFFIELIVKVNAEVRMRTGCFESKNFRFFYICTFSIYDG